MKSNRAYFERLVKEAEEYIGTSKTSSEEMLNYLNAAKTFLELAIDFAWANDLDK